ncbi:hypothetical protein [Alistipes sp. ZOR0009]|uniref:hypothetical protein n=1 Tax=Alistipes sp. ZOR0009 TaxID=1339253 RepID=UPI0012E04B85|nr:hypothetical protein [Alistipes sp. ZOR0009]
MTTKHYSKFLFILMVLVASSALAQNTDTTKRSETLKLVQPEKKLLPSIQYSPYFYAPKVLNYKLKYYSIANSSISEHVKKSKSTDNAMRLIQLTLENDKKIAKQNEILSIINVAGVLGGVVYQAAHGESMSKDAQKAREAKASPPTRR